MSHHVTKSEFARMAGVNPSTIARMAPKHFSGAMYGKRVDAAHPEAIAYLEGRNIDVSQFKPAEPKPMGDRKAKGKVGAAAKLEKMKARLSNYELSALPDDLKDWLSSVTIGDIDKVFGSDVAFRDYVAGGKTLRQNILLDTKIDIESGRLVEKSLINFILEPVEKYNVLLLTDGSKKISQRLAAKFKAGATVEDGAQYIQEEISKFIKPMKTQMQRRIEDGQ